ncbi:MAG: hypothetical protein QXX23_07165 [Thermoplasmata archaeon]
MAEEEEEEEEEESEEKEFTEEDAMEICYRVCNSMRKYFLEGKLDDDDDEYESIRTYYVRRLIDDDDEVCYSLCEDSTYRQRDLKQMRAEAYKIVKPKE